MSEETPTPSPAKRRPSPPSAGGRKRAPVDLANARKIIAKATQIAQADPALRANLAVLVGAPADDLAALVVAALAGPREVGAVLSAIDELRALDPIETGVRCMAAAMENPQGNKAMWAALHAYGKIGEAVPANPAKAAIALAAAIRRLSDDDMATMRAPMGLID